MRLVFLTLMGVFLLALDSLAQGTVTQPGYMRRDGTYVAPHYRAALDANRYNNWSSQPNVNPYTGQRGSVDPIRPPSSGGSNSYRNQYRAPQSNPYGSGRR